MDRVPITQDSSTIPSSPSAPPNRISEMSERDIWRYDPNYQRMARFLGLTHEESMDERMASKISFLRDFTNEKDEVEAIGKIKGIVKGLGVTFRGRELIDHLYEYARLEQDRQRIQKEIDLYKEKKEEPKEVDVTKVIKQEIGKATKDVVKTVKTEIKKQAPKKEKEPEVDYYATAQG